LTCQIRANIRKEIERNDKNISKSANSAKCAKSAKGKGNPTPERGRVKPCGKDLL
jgi:hypothetical protein